MPRSRSESPRMLRFARSASSAWVSPAVRRKARSRAPKLSSDGVVIVAALLSGQPVSREKLNDTALLGYDSTLVAYAACTGSPVARCVPGHPDVTAGILLTPTLTPTPWDRTECSGIVKPVKSQICGRNGTV